jgi:hypothetical protein
MTQAERDVIEAARAAVVVQPSGNVMVGNVTSDTEKLRALVRAVVHLDAARAASEYWR